MSLPTRYICGEPFERQSMESTTLTLMTSDGPLCITFRPMLSTEQYSALCQFVAATNLRSKRDFREFLGQIAAEWGVSFEADGQILR